jgi:leucyl aminopeptidase
MLCKVFRSPAIYSQGLKGLLQRDPTVRTLFLTSKAVTHRFIYENICNSNSKGIHHSLNRSVLGQRREVVTMAVGVDYSCTEEITRANSGLVSKQNANFSESTEIYFISGGDVEGWKESLSGRELGWVKATGFSGNEGDLLLMPSENGGVAYVLAVIDDATDLWGYAGLQAKLPPGTYYTTTLKASHEGATLPAPDALALGWILGSYSFDRYKSKKSDTIEAKKVRLVWPDVSDETAIIAMAEGIFLARDMISTPAEDMAPQHIEKEARDLANIHSATVSCIVGDDLLKENYPAIHTVGRASTNAPRLIDMRWSPSGKANLPKITLVGKGVSFDTGGLDLKPANAMKLMKKDMGGAAFVLGLAHAIMKTQLPVQLRVLVPAVENSVSGNAFRPLDVLQTRAGITVENGNTDAEGRLILCDALAEAVSEKPELLLDAATLTGAARVALGTEMPALFCTSDEVADDIIKTSNQVHDYMWRMPLHKPYRKMINSKVADIGSCSEGGYAGAITAALFLEEFVKDAPVWAHIDTMGYNLSSKPGRPEGGEALALRAVYKYLSSKYS